MANDAAAARVNTVETLLRQKMDWLNKSITMLIQQGLDSTDAQREYSRCATWLVDLNTGQPASIPDPSDDADLLNAIHALEVYAASGSAANALITAVNGLIAAYGAPA